MIEINDASAIAARPPPVWVKGGKSGSRQDTGKAMIEIDDASASEDELVAIVERRRNAAGVRRQRRSTAGSRQDTGKAMIEIDDASASEDELVAIVQLHRDAAGVRGQRWSANRDGGRIREKR